MQNTIDLPSEVARIGLRLNAMGSSQSVAIYRPHRSGGELIHCSRPLPRLPRCDFTEKNTKKEEVSFGAEAETQHIPNTSNSPTMD